MLRDDHLIELAKLLEEIISEDAIGGKKTSASQSNRCYAVKSGKDVLLDVGNKWLFKLKFKAQFLFK